VEEALASRPIDSLQGRTMAIAHSQIGPIADEVGHVVRGLAQKFPVVTQ